MNLKMLKLPSQTEEGPTSHFLFSCSSKPGGHARARLEDSQNLEGNRLRCPFQKGWCTCRGKPSFISCEHEKHTLTLGLVGITEAVKPGPSRALPWAGYCLGQAHSTLAPLSMPLQGPATARWAGRRLSPQPEWRSHSLFPSHRCPEAWAELPGSRHGGSVGFQQVLQGSRACARQTAPGLAGPWEPTGGITPVFHLSLSPPGFMTVILLGSPGVSRGPQYPVTRALSWHFRRK